MREDTAHLGEHHSAAFLHWIRKLAEHESASFLPAWFLHQIPVLTSFSDEPILGNVRENKPFLPPDDYSRREQTRTGP